VAGLLGLLLLTDAPREARVRNGRLVPLGEQDRATAEADAPVPGTIAGHVPRWYA